MSETADIDIRRDGWTEAADAALAELLADGIGPVEIWLIMNCSRQSVWNRRAKLKLPSAGLGGAREHAQPAGVYRMCLGCGREFRSLWIGNRLCISCKDT